MGLRKGPLCLRSQVAGLQDRRIFGRQLTQYACHTARQRVNWRDRFWLRAGYLIDFFGKLLGRPCQAGAVNQRVARDLEQPRARVVKATKALLLAHCLHEDILKHIIGRIGIRQTMAQESKQLALM